MRPDDPVIEKGRRAVAIAKKLWPALVLQEEGGSSDRDGTDAVLRAGKLRVQVKCHEPMAKYKDCYLEVWEKTKEQHNQSWRVGLAHADVYIFVCPGRAVWVSMHALAQAALNQRVIQLNETSIGFIIPLSSIPEDQRVIKQHNLWNNRMLI